MPSRCSAEGVAGPGPEPVPEPATETTPLLAAEPPDRSRSPDPDLERGPKATDSPPIPAGPRAAVFRIVAVLLVGAFTASADGSLVIATHPTIASQFDALASSSWLFVSYNLAGAASQAMYGKLSDIYGRRAMLITAYAFFAAGCALVGTGRSMGEVILGRVISGCGGSALNVLGMLVITDLVALREAAVWLSGVNLAATTGRSLGGPLGGWLADTVGWRWSFLGQVPVFLAAIVLCVIWLPPGAPRSASDAPMPGGRKGLARIDFLGTALLALTILAFLVPLEIGGARVPWGHPAVLGLGAAAIVLGGLFVLTEARWAAEPVLPVELLRHHDVLLSYSVTFLQVAAQLGLMFSVPLYFQVTQRVSNKVAGAYLCPAVAGNALGAVLAGLVIKRTGRYKPVLMAATAVSSLSYALLLLRWRGHTSIWEALYIFPGGLGTGMVQAAIFVSIQAAVDPAHKAPAMAGNFLVTTVGAIVGMAAANAAMTRTMQGELDAQLEAMRLDRTARESIIERATSGIDYLDEAPQDVAAAVVQAYVRGLSCGHAFSLAAAALAVLACSVLREKKL